MISIDDIFHEEEKISFYIYNEEDCSLSKEAEQYVIENAKCMNCNANIDKNFNPCKCNKEELSENQIGHYYILSKINDYGIHSDEKLNKYCQQARRRQYDKENKQIRRDRLKDAEGFHSKENIKQLWEIQQGKCYFCGITLKTPQEKTPFEIEHLTPVSQHGTNWIQNIALSCADCNRSKYSKTASQFWSLLRKKNGTDWVKERQIFNRSCLSKKRKISNYNKTNCTDCHGLKPSQ